MEQQFVKNNEINITVRQRKGTEARLEVPEQTRSEAGEGAWLSKRPTAHVVTGRQAVAPEVFWKDPWGQGRHGVLLLLSWSTVPATHLYSSHSPKLPAGTYVPVKAPIIDEHARQYMRENVLVL
jgi:hypothetical protein